MDTQPFTCVPICSCSDRKCGHDCFYCFECDSTHCPDCCVIGATDIHDPNDDSEKVQICTRCFLGISPNHLEALQFACEFLKSNDQMIKLLNAFCSRLLETKDPLFERWGESLALEGSSPSAAEESEKEDSHVTSEESDGEDAYVPSEESDPDDEGVFSEDDVPSTPPIKRMRK
jgi:hypothetical protein